MPETWRGDFVTIGVALLLCAVILFLLFYPRLQLILLVGLSCFCGGSLSNLFDRIVHGSVVDFIKVNWGGLRPYIFNLADVAIVVGLIFILLSLLFVRVYMNSPVPRKIRL
ncbi:MAG: signal peptidase II [Syntrophobacteraceae bacterium]